MKKFLALAAILLLFAPSTASADVQNVTASPANRNVSLNGGSAVTVTWTITRTPAGAPFTLQTSAGAFKAAFNATDTWGTTPVITRSYATNQTSMTIVETFVVPPAIARKALEANGGNFILTRNFTDNAFATQFPAEIDMHVTGGGDGTLGIQQETLSFDTGAATAMVAQNAPLKARAELSVSGMGQLDAIWEINDTGTGGDTFYRPLKRVTVTLAGQRTAVLTSPLLPTAQTGRNDVRLRILSPQTGFAPASIVYFVTGKNGARAKLPAIAVSSPANGAHVTEKTAFAWNGADGAAGYKLEIFSSANAYSAVAKMMVKAGTHQTRLSDLTLSKTPAGAYRWQVTAFDKNGRALAASAPRLFYIGGDARAGKTAPAKK